MDDSAFKVRVIFRILGFWISNKELIVPERIFKIAEIVPSKGSTYREIILNAKNHEIHLWRVSPGEWIYPHTHPHSDDIWYIVQGVGEYYTTSKEKKTVQPGDIAVASPRDVHGIFNSGSEDIVILSVLSPLPIEMDEASGFEYPA
jgi:quercetin dioxygenase-like cupin family protein